MKIGLVLGGGFARGAAQAGFLKGLLNYLKPEEIALMSCSSIGAMNGLALSNDNLDYLEYMYRNSNFQNTSNLKLNLKNKLVDQVLDELTNNHNEIRVPLYVTGTCLNSLSTHYFYIDKLLLRYLHLVLLNLLFLKYYFYIVFPFNQPLLIKKIPSIRISIIYILIKLTNPH